MMDITLCLKSALELYHVARIADGPEEARNPAARYKPLELTASRASGLGCSPESAEDASVVARQFQTFDDVQTDTGSVPVVGLTPPVHFLATRTASHWNVAGRKVFRTNEPLIENSLVYLESGLRLSSPEHVLLHASPHLDAIGLAWLASEMCSLYTVHPTLMGPLLPARPLTTTARLRAYLEKAAATKTYGAKKALRALDLAIEHAASPRELGMAFFLTFPRSMGGRAVPKPLLNHPVKPDMRFSSNHRREPFCIDLCWPEAKLALEYNSDSHHLDSKQAAHDNNKAATLSEMGWYVLGLSSKQFESLSMSDDNYLRIAKHLKVRNRAGDARYDWQGRRSDLYNRIWRLLNAGGAMHELILKLDSGSGRSGAAQ